MATTSALTKKQQKALAFRKKKSAPTTTTKRQEQEQLDVPEVEDLDQLEQVAVSEEPTPPSPQTQAAAPAKRSTAKRKREHDDEQKDAPAKKPKVDDSQSTDKPHAQRYILFVGNLQYRTTKEQIAQHFSACVPPPTIRLLTPKVAPGKSTVKSKGCAFLEFQGNNTLQQALKLHGSELDGRKINVELTAGGGGKSAQRIEKVRKRNKELEVQRKKRKLKSGQSGDAEPEDERPQRHSKTSGAELVLPKAKTWSVGEVAAQGRGGTMHAKRGSKRKDRMPMPRGTGANAVSLG